MYLEIRYKTIYITHTKAMKSEMKESMCRIGKILGITIAVYACIRWLLPMVIPFFIAFLLAKLLNPAVEKINKKVKIKRGIISAVLVGILVVMTGTALVIFLQTLIGQVHHIISNLEEYQRKAGVVWDNCCGQLEVLTGIEAEIFQQNVEGYIPVIRNRMEEKMVPSLLDGTILYVKNFFILGGICFIVIVSTILILRDYGKIRKGLEDHPVGKMGLKVCRRTYEAGGAYIKAQLMIMLIISAVCVAGLYFSGNNYALLAGCGIGICDAMPFLGTGTVLVPWAVFELVQGKYMMAAICAAIYAVCSLLREILEPKLVGDKLGMHPLMVIASIYIGLNLYGIWGFVLGPFSYILIREIYCCNLC